MTAPPDVELELCAHGAGYAYSRQIRVKAGEQEHVIRVRRALELFGRVTDSETGQPITDCKAFPGYGDGDLNAAVRAGARTEGMPCISKRLDCLGVSALKPTTSTG